MRLGYLVMSENEEVQGKSYADAYISVTHGSPKLTDVRNDIRDADPKDKVKSVDLWIHVYLVRV